MPAWTVPLASAVIAALLAAGVVGVATVDDGGGDDGSRARPSARSSPSAAATTAPAPQGPQALAAAVPELRAFVERERGLAFKRPVEVTLVDGDRFEARLAETEDEELDEVRDAEAVLRAMGLLDRGVDLAAAVRRFTAGAVLGFYDTETKELVVRGDEATPYVRTVLVHELTHALEDQHFDLDRGDLGDEAFLGFLALVEGSAVRIEDRYRASLSRRDRQSLERDERAQGARAALDVPEVVQALFSFPYAYGPDLVQAVVRAGGQARLDGAYADPPASSEQVLDPRRYLTGDDPRPVAVPAADGPAFDDGEIGELFLALMLDAELGSRQAQAAARGWGGDHYVAWTDGDRTCVRIEFVMDTEDDTAELAEALARWADERGGGATATGTSLRTCG